MRRALLAGIMTAGLAASAAPAAVVDEFTVNDWSGLALADDRTGRLASCTVYAKYQNGATLFFIRHVDGNWTMSIVHETWKLDRDGEYPVRLKVDREAPVDLVSVALDRDQVGVALSGDDPVLAQVRRGQHLAIDFQGKEYGFELSNSRKALDGASDCVRRNRDIDGPRLAQQPPLANDGAPAPAPAGDPPAAAEPDGPADTDTASEASPIGDREMFGPWVVTATDDGAGRFVNCTAFGLFGDDQIILSRRPDGAWEFGLYRAAWALDTNQTYFLWYNVGAPADGAGVIKRPVEAVEPTRIFFELSVNEDLLSRMRADAELNLQLHGFSREPESLSYPLTQTAAALDATQACLQRNTSLPPPGPVFDGGAAAAPGDGDGSRKIVN